jgi:hypothetical protein
MQNSPLMNYTILTKYLKYLDQYQIDDIEHLFFKLIKSSENYDYYINQLIPKINIHFNYRYQSSYLKLTLEYNKIDLFLKLYEMGAKYSNYDNLYIKFCIFYKYYIEKLKRLLL